MKTKIFLSIFCISALVHGQSANQVIKKLQNKFNSITNFTANFSQSNFNAHGQDQGKTLGKITYQRKNKFIVELKTQTIVSDGVTIWNSDKRFNRVVISNLADDPTSFSLERFVFDYPPLCKMKIVSEDPLSKGSDYIELTPKDNDMEFKYVRIWLAADGMISKLEFLDLGDIRYAIQFTDLKINQEISEARFTFYSSKGMKIIDLR